ncbi:hypothetical protein [Nocardioides sp. 616]|nr:hypothetical protein [Nocardioides sp. 616]
MVGTSAASKRGHVPGALVAPHDVIELLDGQLRLAVRQQRVDP